MANRTGNNSLAENRTRVKPRGCDYRSEPTAKKMSVKSDIKVLQIVTCYKVLNAIVLPAIIIHES